MIYATRYNELPNAIQVRSILKKIQNQVPVKHLMPTERVVDGEDKYLLTHLANGRFVIKPNITKQGVLYYGNNNGEEYKEKFRLKYYPTVKDEQNIHDQLMYNNVRLEQFKLLVESFPLFKLLDKGIDIPGIDLKFSLGNPYGLAAAYGLPSPYLNLTSSMDVALFYATNKYNEETNQFEPVDEKDEKRGIVYMYRVLQPLGQTSSLSTLGVEVFPRTFNSRNFLALVSPTVNFNEEDYIFGLTFKQTRDASEYFNDLFKKGELLQPQDDFLGAKLNSIKKQIFEDAIDINLRKNPDDSKEKNERFLKSQKLNITSGSPKFSKSDLLHVDLLGLWGNFISKISPLNDSDSKIKEYLKQLPGLEKYSKYFEIK